MRHCGLAGRGTRMVEFNDDANGGSAGGRTPPYIPFQTLLTLLEELRTNGVPAQIDRSVLKRFSGATGTQLLGAVRSLGLVDTEDRPTPQLVAMVNAEGEDLKPLLNNLLKNSYPYVFKLDLMTATPAMFAEAFKTNTGAKEDVLRKCRTFFIHAAKKADVPLGPRLQSGSAPRSPNGSGVKRRVKGKGKEERAHGERADKDISTSNEKPAHLMGALLAKFPEFDPSWPDEIKTKWFEGFEQFMKGATSK